MKKHAGIRRRGKDDKTWEIRLHLGYEIVQGVRKKKQHRELFHGTEREALVKRAELVTALSKKTFVAKSDVTTIAWVRRWVGRLECSPGTFERYDGIIENILSKSKLADMLIQDVTASDVEDYLNTIVTKTGAKQSASSILTHLTILKQSFRIAMRDKKVSNNVVLAVESKPKRPRAMNAESRRHCYTAAEAATLMAYVKAHGTLQEQALVALALDLGPRKNELCGLHWTEVHIESNQVDITQQLRRGKKGTNPKGWFRETKTGEERIGQTISPATMQLLKQHKQQQAEFKMQHRNMYHDLGLVFAKELGHLRTHRSCFGHPLQSNNLGERWFARLCKAAGLKRIKFHGLRHTCATLLLRAGKPIHVVSQRLGHADVATTHKHYAHVLPDQQQDAAAAIGAILHG